MTQCEELLAAFRRGEKLSVRDALLKYGVYALSQRVGELKREHDIRSEMVKVGKKHVARYWME